MLELVSFYIGLIVLCLGGLMTILLGIYYLNIIFQWVFEGLIDTLHGMSNYYIFRKWYNSDEGKAVREPHQARWRWLYKIQSWISGGGK